MPEDYVRTVLIAGRAGSDTVPILIDSDGRLIVTGGVWNDYIPVIAWYGGTPSPVTIKGRWKKVGSIAFVNISIQANISLGCVLQSVTLPEAVTNNVAYVPFCCHVWTYAGAGSLIVPQAALVIRTSNPSLIMVAGTEASEENLPIIYSISGCYEVPV